MYHRSAGVPIPAWDEVRTEQSRTGEPIAHRQSDHAPHQASQMTSQMASSLPPVCVKDAWKLHGPELYSMHSVYPNTQYHTHQDARSYTQQQQQQYGSSLAFEAPREASQWMDPLSHLRAELQQPLPLVIRAIEHYLTDSGAWPADQPVTTATTGSITNSSVMIAEDYTTMGNATPIVRPVSPLSIQITGPCESPQRAGLMGGLITNSWNTASPRQAVIASPVANTAGPAQQQSHSAGTVASVDGDDSVLQRARSLLQRIECTSATRHQQEASSPYAALSPMAGGTFTASDAALWSPMITPTAAASGAAYSQALATVEASTAVQELVKQLVSAELAARGLTDSSAATGATHSSHSPRVTAVEHVTIAVQPPTPGRAVMPSTAASGLDRATTTAYPPLSQPFMLPAAASSVVGSSATGRTSAPVNSSTSSTSTSALLTPPIKMTRQLLQLREIEQQVPAQAVPVFAGAAPAPPMTVVSVTPSTLQFAVPVGKKIKMQRTITLKNLSPDHSAVFKVLTQKRSQHLYVVRPTAGYIPPSGIVDVNIVLVGTFFDPHKLYQALAQQHTPAAETTGIGALTPSQPVSGNDQITLPATAHATSSSTRFEHHFVVRCCHVSSSDVSSVTAEQYWKTRGSKPALPNVIGAAAARFVLQETPLVSIITPQHAITAPAAAISSAPAAAGESPNTQRRRFSIFAKKLAEQQLQQQQEQTQAQQTQLVSNSSTLATPSNPDAPARLRVAALDSKVNSASPIQASRSSPRASGTVEQNSKHHRRASSRSRHRSISPTASQHSGVSRVSSSAGSRSHSQSRSSHRVKSITTPRETAVSSAAAVVTAVPASQPYSRSTTSLTTPPQSRRRLKSALRSVARNISDDDDDDEDNRAALPQQSVTDLRARRRHSGQSQQSSTSSRHPHHARQSTSRRGSSASRQSVRAEAEPSPNCDQREMDHEDHKHDHRTSTDRGIMSRPVPMQLLQQGVDLQVLYRSDRRQLFGFGRLVHQSGLPKARRFVVERDAATAAVSGWVLRWGPTQDQLTQKSAELAQHAVWGKLPKVLRSKWVTAGRKPSVVARAESNSDPSADAVAPVVYTHSLPLAELCGIVHAQPCVGDPFAATRFTFHSDDLSRNSRQLRDAVVDPALCLTLLSPALPDGGALDIACPDTRTLRAVISALQSFALASMLAMPGGSSLRSSISRGANTAGNTMASGAAAAGTSSVKPVSAIAHASLKQTWQSDAMVSWRLFALRVMDKRRALQHVES